MPLLCRNFLWHLLPKTHLAGLVIPSNTLRLARPFAVTTWSFAIHLFFSVHQYMAIMMVGKFINKSALFTAQCEFTGMGYKDKWRNGEQSLAVSQKAAPNYKGGIPGSIQIREIISTTGLDLYLWIFYFTFDFFQYYTAFQIKSKNLPCIACLKRFSIT